MKETVGVVRCQDYNQDQVQLKLNELLELLGGWESFISPGDKVFVKINLLMKKSPEEAVTTHPAVVKGVVKHLMDLGAQVTIGDSPGGPFKASLLKSIYRISGIEQVAQETGAILNFDTRVISKEFHQGRVVKRFALCQAMVECDKMVAISKLKTHGMTKYTGAVKVLFGCVPGLEKAEYHLRMPNLTDFSHMLIDLALLTKPTLSIMDGVVGMEGAGPSGGDPKQVGILLASANPFALDVVAATAIGLDITEVPTIKGAGEIDLASRVQDVHVVGDVFSEGVMPLCTFVAPEIHHHVRFPFPKGVNNFLERYLRPKPIFHQGDCAKCGDCINLCPPKALTMGADVPKLELGKCIRCFCCQELCPKKAITIKRPWVTKQLFR